MSEHSGAEHGLAMICSPEEIVIESVKPGIFIAECDLELNLAGSGKRETCMGRRCPGGRNRAFRDWRRSELFRKSFPDW